MGCVRKTPHRKIKQVWDVQEKIPQEKASMGWVKETPHRKIKPARGV